MHFYHLFTNELFSYDLLSLYCEIWRSILSLIFLLLLITYLFLKFAIDPKIRIRETKNKLSPQAYQNLLSQYKVWANQQFFLDRIRIDKTELEISLTNYINASANQPNATWLPPQTKTDIAITRYRHSDNNFQRKHFMCFYPYAKLSIIFAVTTAVIALLLWLFGGYRY